MNDVEQKLKQLADETIWGVNGFRSDTEPTAERVFRALLQVRNETLESERETLSKIMEMIQAAPKLNPNNYNHDDVCELNQAVINLYHQASALRQLKEKVK